VVGHSYAVSVEADVFIARQAAERLATAEGFPRLAAQEVALIVSELAWNIVRHAGGGRIDLAVITDLRHGRGLEIRAWDPKPPIPDLALAQRDGHTAGGPIPPGAMLHRRGIGSGLGAVARLGDRVVQEPSDPGKCLVVTRYRVRPRPTQG
jgi:anti-sigma regulatory factor (Ser/Thr protein kinase)